MKSVLQRLAKYLAYFMAAVVIFLAVAVGLFRLMLPRLPEYQEEIKSWASDAIGMQVDFAGMNARWRLRGPEINFYNAELIRASDSDSLLRVDELSVGVGLMRLLVDRELVVDRVLITDTSFDLRQGEDGGWLVQGVPLEELIVARPDLPEGGGAAVTVTGQDIGLDYWPSGAEQAIELMIDNLQVRRDELGLDIELTVDLPDELGERLEISAVKRTDGEAVTGAWEFFVEGTSLTVPGWTRFQPSGLPVLSSGKADLSLWLKRSQDGIRSATGNLVVTDLVAGDAFESPFGIQGRFEFSNDPQGWLLAADNFRLQAVAGEWPNSSLRADVTVDASGRVQAIDARASFINLDNLKLVSPWLPENERSMLDELAPSGMVHGLELRLTDLGSDSVRFDVSAELEEAGIRAKDKWPGVSGFSGQIRADRSGGRIEIESTDLRLDMPKLLGEVIEFDDAIGTVIWRRSKDSTIILSDSVRIRNADLDTRSSLQVSLPSDGGSPLIDFVSNWNMTDVSAVPRYLPVKVMKPKLYAWYERALVAGRVLRGMTRITGPLDKLPFEGGEGTLRLEAHVEDGILRFNPKWPPVVQVSADIVIENTRFFSNHNTATMLGNTTVDARAEIANMRNPVLTIDASSASTLESMRQLSMNSPISNVFGGQLERMQVDGEASFDLQLRYPIRDKLNYEFRTSIRSNGGRLSIQGFAPPLTELSGLVTITRDTMQSDGLTARFLGEPVDIDVSRATEDQPQYFAIVSASGIATAEGLIGELGLPLAGRLEGSTPYDASILFPRGKLENPVPLHIAVDTDLEGIALEVPAPVGKGADEIRSLSVHIEFPEPDRIDSFGDAGEDIKWSASFLKGEDAWDFDRGVVAVGGGQAFVPETRGLHIVGETPEVRLKAWLRTAPQGSDGPGFGERIRSIDLTVGDLYVVGQHFSRHRVQVNRGAQEWLVKADGEEAVGTVVVPYDFSGDRPLVVDMQKLILPGSGDDQAEVGEPTDPRRLPPVSIKAAEFALGLRHFGALEATFERTDRGLESTGITTTDDSFELSGAGRWVVEPADEAGQRSYLTGKLISTDIVQTTKRLNYEPGIVGGDMEIDIDVTWPGGPREDLLSYVDGNIGIRLSSGQLDLVDPGAGRVFGLMSVAALPRRLSLDFRDVFAKGFGYDEITGNFRLASGETYTCDLTLKGPAADIGIVGRAGLVSRDYHQTAIVSASVGDTLPVVGAVVAGPQVAAALLIFSQIFKKPLQEMGQIYYSIDGSWDEPAVEVANADQFASTYELAGCLKDSEYDVRER
ncbi:MAG: YhdP family protein [Woeseiaceae bacterium]